jgi:hypothetical protein
VNVPHYAHPCSNLAMNFKKPPPRLHLLDVIELCGGSLLHASGPSTRVRIRVLLCVRFHARIICKPDRGPILLPTPSAYTFQKNKYCKFNCGTALASNRTPNRTPIPIQNCIQKTHEISVTIP